MYRHLFIVESPFQLLGAIEAQKIYGGYCVLIVRLHPSPAKNSHIIEVLNLSASWDEVHKIGEGISLRVGLLKVYWTLFRMRHVEWNRIFIGEGRSLFICRLADIMRNNGIFFLDDGVATFSIQEETSPIRGGQRQGLRRLNSKKAALADKLLGGLLAWWCNSSSAIYNLFTCFDVEPHTYGQVIEKHTFSYLKSLDKGRPVKDSEVLFFGQWLSECGIVKREYEKDCLKRVGRYYADIGLSVRYVPHRLDSKEKLNLIRSIGWEIEIFDCPAELYIIKRQHLPSRIASFTSTTLFTLPRIVDIKQLDVFLINNEKVLSDFFRVIMERLYKRLETERRATIIAI